MSESVSHWEMKGPALFPPYSAFQVLVPVPKAVVRLLRVCSADKLGPGERLGPGSCIMCCWLMNSWELTHTDTHTA
jgi:hypothetical protein